MWAVRQISDWKILLGQGPSFHFSYSSWEHVLLKVKASQVIEKSCVSLLREQERPKVIKKNGETRRNHNFEKICLFPDIFSSDKFTSHIIFYPLKRRRIPKDFCNWGQIPSKGSSSRLLRANKKARAKCFQNSFFYILRTFLSHFKGMLLGFIWTQYRTPSCFLRQKSPKVFSLTLKTSHCSLWNFSAKVTISAKEYPILHPDYLKIHLSHQLPLYVSLYFLSIWVLIVLRT